MAAQADGTVLIDTEIKKDGAIDDVSSLKEALRELTVAVKDLTSNLSGFFAGTDKQAGAAAKQVDQITESAKEAAVSVQSLEDQMSKITVDHGDLNNNTGDWQRESHPRGEFIDYGNTVQDFVDKYAAGMNVVTAKNAEVKQSTKQVVNEVKGEFEEAEQAPSMLGNTIWLLKNTVMSLISTVRAAGSGFTESFASGGAQVMSVGQKVDALKGKIDSLEKQGLYFGDKEYDQAYTSLKRAEAELEQYKRNLTGVNTEQQKATKSNKGLNKGLKETKRNANGAKMSIMGMLGRSLLFSMVFRALSGVSNAIKEGTQNIARYSDSTNKAMSKLMSSLTMLKNSFAAAFAPVIEYVTPALSALISKLADVNNWIAQTMAALAGKDTFTKAVAVQEDYAASLTDTQKAAKEAAKAVEKASFAFDTLIQIQKSSTTDTGYTAPTPDQMFETIAVENEAKALAEDIKSVLSDLFSPLKASWDQYGPSTVAAVKTMLGSLKQLAGDVGASFMQVWKDEGYGKAITDDLLITFSNFALTIANLADQFDKAWTEADTGTNIMRHLGDLVLVVTGFFREASESIKNWAATLDFSPLLKSFDGLLVSLTPIVSKIGDVLLWLLNNVLLPLAKWALEKAIPAAFDLISASLEVLNSVLDALKPLALWLWEYIGEPQWKAAGDIIIGVIKGITEKLKEFSDWINKHQELVENATIIIGSFFAAWEFVKFVNGIKGIINVLPGLIDKLGLLLGKLNPVMLVLAAVIAIAVYVARAWDKMTPGDKLASKIIAVAGAIALVVAAIAYGMHDLMTLAGALAIAAIAGVSLIGIASSANSRASSYSVPSYSSSGYSSLSSIMPRLATGTVVPPRAGEFAAILGDNNKDYEVVSPLGTIKEAVLDALKEAGGIGNGTATADLIIDGTKFGQLVYKYNNKETERVGVRMVTTGG